MDKKNDIYSQKTPKNAKKCNNWLICATKMTKSGIYLQLELKNEKSKMKRRKDEGVNEEWR